MIFQSMTIENDVSDYLKRNLKYCKVKQFWITGTLPLDKIMTLVPSNMEDSVQSELNNLSLE